MASLTVIKGPDRGRRFELSDPVPSIGRDAKSAVRLHDGEVSRTHAEIRKSGGDFVLYDLGSSNGTFLNNERIDYRPIKTGDRIRLGQTELIFTADATAPPAAANLSGKINVVANRKVAESSAILRSMSQSEGSEFLKHPERVDSQWLKEALGNLAIVYETSRAASRIADVHQLLDHIMGLVFQSIKPDRGCVMLKSPETGKLEPTAVRFASGTDPNQKITLSRSITEWVLQRNEGAIVVDAPHDSRFGPTQSIVELGIREAICVPLRGRHETFGVLYVDIKSDGKDVLKTQRPTKFTEEHLKLVIAIAHQAGLAIEDSRFYQAMMQAERLAAVGQTIASLSHHIKNILQGLRSGSYLVEMGLKDKKFEVLEQGWGVVQKNQEKIYNLVMDMLSFSKEREPNLQPTDLNTVISDIVELMAGRAKNLGARLEMQLDPELGEVLLDGEAIHRAVLNIVSNALDAVEGVANPKVIVSAAIEERGRYLHVTVADNGVGIPEERRDAIFQIFNSTKGTRGTGLGLAVSQKIAREHGGTIRVTSQVGKGSQFILELPARRPGDVPATGPVPTMTDMDDILQEKAG